MRQSMKVVWMVREHKTGETRSVTVADGHDDSIASVLRELYPPEFFSIISQSIPEFPVVIAREDDLGYLEDVTARMESYG